MKSPADKVQTTPTELLNTKEAARFFRIHPHTLEKWRMNRHPIDFTPPDYVLVGRSVFYRRSTLELWLQRRTFNHTADYGANPRTLYRPPRTRQPMKPQRPPRQPTKPEHPLTT